MNNLPTQTTNHLPSNQAQSLGFIKSLLKAVEQANPIEIAKLERTITIDTAIQGIPLINAIKETDEELVISGLMTLIIRAASFFNLGKLMTEDQAADTAYLLLDKYPVETMEDFTLMFRNGKSGKYGMLNKSFDGQVIFGWMEKYLDQKAEALENLHRKQKSQPDSLNLLKVVQEYSEELKSLESPLNEAVEKPQEFKSVVDALKEAIDFDGLESNEKEYLAYRNEFFKKNSQFE